MFGFQKKPNELDLDSLEYRSVWRQIVLQRLIELEAPKFIIERQQKLLSEVSEDIAKRRTEIMEKVKADREALDEKSMKEAEEINGGVLDDAEDSCCSRI